MKQTFAEVITIGDEILFGQITDTNTQYISEQLSLIGIKTIRKSSVGDNEKDILGVLSEAINRADVIILTGGLGPTKDDITKLTLCKFLGTDLIIHEPTLVHVRSFFEKRGKPMLEINNQQAAVPRICEVLFNDVGTAPGMWMIYNEKIIISLPGVPYEMKFLMQNRVLSKLKSHIETPFIYHKMIHTVAIGESFLAETIKDWENNLPKHIKLAYLPSLGIVKLRLTAIGEDSKKIITEVEQLVEKLEKLIHPHIFGFDLDNKIEEVVGKFLVSQNKTLATAESCTGGYLASLITSISGCSAYFKGSVLAYSNEVKINVLDVNKLDLETEGAVSEKVVKQMALNVRQKLNTNIGISISGIAGPSGGTVEKPVGTVWVGYSDEKNTFAQKFIFGNLRENNIKLASIYALNMLLKELKKVS
ncbi:MAG: competence/damage-inducible protein A [Bacteroidetes bacterium]|nr:MAG: competence/damage-inducible protein A [Bacteroidota bacterium]